tara:strand:+ start:397 stop:1596 length:1200 start_codon:yes stop_codon:yes gene_type:complete
VSESGRDFHPDSSEIFGLLKRPTALSDLKYDLNAGVPDPNSLPSEALGRAFTRILESNPEESLTYDTIHFGFPALKAFIAHKYADSVAGINDDWVTMVSGSAHGLDNIASAFFDKGDGVIVGAPSYPGAIRTFTARGASVFAARQDASGITGDSLKLVLEKCQDENIRVKAIYLIPNYDNPSSVLMPVERRKEILQIAQDYKVLVIEDGAYAGVDLSGAPPDSLFEMAGGEGVIYCGTFSKTIATGLRSGYLMASPDITRSLRFMRLDNASSPLVQRAIYEFVSSDEYESHLSKILSIYRARRDAASESLIKYCGRFVEFDEPKGGFFHWLRLRDGISASSIVSKAREFGVAVSAGSGYYLEDDPESDSRVRLVFSTLSEDDLADAIELLGKSFESIRK